jgi:hypothetical protein
MNDALARLEARMESLVEGTLARLFAGRVHPRDVALQLARALEDSGARGTPATLYIVRLSPADAEALLRARPDLPRLLANELLSLARDAQLTLAQAPEVIFQPDPRQTPHSLLVTADPHPSSGDTQTITPIQPVQAAAVPLAFLILEGERTVMLTQPVISLGRRFDNTIIFDDPRVSRAHAQLRLRFGRYVLYDLGSRGGTFVNGQRVEEVVLRPGDVISLGGVPVIYGEDDSARPGAAQAGGGSAHGEPAGTRPLPRPGTAPLPPNGASGDGTVPPTPKP